MVKNKPKRSMAQVGESQQVTEETHSDKFRETMSLATPVARPASSGRNYPQVSYTISQEDKETMGRLSISQTIKKNRIVSQSEIFRALIRLGVKMENELEFE